MQDRNVKMLGAFIEGCAFCVEPSHPEGEPEGAVSLMPYRDNALKALVRAWRGGQPPEAVARALGIDVTELLNRISALPLGWDDGTANAVVTKRKEEIAAAANQATRLLDFLYGMLGGGGPLESDLAPALAATHAACCRFAEIAFVRVEEMP